VLAGDVAD
jgi:hypothetical protein